jgi:two-component system, chemotaxis family, chemotaxis protein CheY
VRSILIVDDSASVRTLLRGALEGEGFKVIEAENGLHALEAVSENLVDLLIVDVNMPVMDGMQVIGKVRAMEHHKRTPVFVLTTESGMAMVKQGKALGATAWIVKPVKPEALVKSIRAVLDS